LKKFKLDDAKFMSNPMHPKTTFGMEKDSKQVDITINDVIPIAT